MAQAFFVQGGLSLGVGCLLLLSFLCLSWLPQLIVNSGLLLSIKAGRFLDLKKRLLTSGMFEDAFFSSLSLSWIALHVGQSWQAAMSARQWVIVPSTSTHACAVVILTMPSSAPTAASSRSGLAGLSSSGRLVHRGTCR